MLLNSHLWHHFLGPNAWRNSALESQSLGEFQGIYLPQILSTLNANEKKDPIKMIGF